MIDSDKSSSADPGLRLVMKWTFIALIAVVGLAILVVELTLRWFGAR
jgi:hypothetical protein